MKNQKALLLIAYYFTLWVFFFIDISAYRIVSHSYGLESQPSSGDDSDGSDLEVMDVRLLISFQ